MESRRVLIIAEKEFADTISGGKFLLVLAIFLILGITGASQGVQNYNTALEHYTTDIQGTDFQGTPFFTDLRPTVLEIFRPMGTGLVIIGAILGIAVGFDLISREKEDHTLKILLSNPVYRDEVITGKVLGGVVTLAITLGAVYGIAIALLLISGHVPSTWELGLILIFGGFSLLYLVGYFAIGLAMSTISDRSGMALMYALVIFLFISFIIPPVGTVVEEAFAGEKPLDPYAIYDEPMEEDLISYEAASQIYENKRNIMGSLFGFFSLQHNYNEISIAVISPWRSLLYSGDHSDEPGFYSPDRNPDMWEVFGGLWHNVIALILAPVAFFGLAYVKFLRLDIR